MQFEINLIPIYFLLLQKKKKKKRIMRDVKKKIGGCLL